MAPPPQSGSLRGFCLLRRTFFLAAVALCSLMWEWWRKNGKYITPVFVSSLSAGLLILATLHFKNKRVFEPCWLTVAANVWWFFCILPTCCPPFLPCPLSCSRFAQFSVNAWDSKWQLQLWSTTCSDAWSHRNRLNGPLLTLHLRKVPSLLPALLTRAVLVILHAQAHYQPAITLTFSVLLGLMNQLVMQQHCITNTPRALNKRFPIAKNPNMNLMWGNESVGVPFRHES